MTRSRPLKTAALTAALAAGALTGALLSAGSASAAAQTTGCSHWAQPSKSTSHVRVCGGVVHTKTRVLMHETVYLKNTGSHAQKMSGFLGASWGQAGNGDAFSNVTVAAGHTKAITRAFTVPAKGPYVVSAGITVAKHDAHVQHAVKN